MYSLTELEYNEHLKEFESIYVEKKKALEYIENVWLPLKDKFVGAWTDEYSHIGNRASSRAESAHVKLKKYLQVSTGNLYEVRSKMCLIIENEFNEIKTKLSREKMNLLHSCSTSFYKNVVYRVSICALKELRKQHMKAKLGIMNAVCSGQFTKTMDLLCAHKMINWRNEPLILDLIHSQWRIDGRTLSANVATHNDGHDDGLSVMLEELRIKYQEWPTSKKETTHERIKELLNQSDVLFDPNTRPPKGRPPKPNNKRKAVSSTRRDPSGFEFVEASRQCGLNKGIDHENHTHGDANLFDLNVSSDMWE
ncbi:uncharacterized protein LOC144547523 [Carex rostrata]